jgi:hypothetical protein
MARRSRRIYLTNRPKPSWRDYRVLRVLAAVGTVLAILAVCWFGYRVANGTRNYSFYFNFKSMPANDDGILEWLKSQPAVTGAAVVRAGNQLRVSFAMSLFSRRAVPDVVDATSRLGYEGRAGFSSGYQNDLHLP